MTYIVTRKEQKPRRKSTGITFFNDFKAELSIVIGEIALALKNNRSLTEWDIYGNKDNTLTVCVFAPKETPEKLEEIKRDYKYIMSIFKEETDGRNK